MMNTQESSYKFSIKYEGEKFKNSLIAVEDLTRSLLGLDKALKQLIGLDQRLKGQLQVNAKLKEGSVITELVLFVVVGSSLVQEFPVLESAKNIVEILSLLINLKKKHGETIPPNLPTFIFNNCNIGSVINPAYKDSRFQEAISEIFYPVENDKSSKMEVKGSDGVILTEISKEDSIMVSKPLKAETQEDQISNQRLWMTVEGPHLESDKLWDLSSSDNRIFRVRMLDEEFLKKVKTGKIRFGHGDQLDVNLQVKTGGSSTFTITKVFGIKEFSPKQQESFFDKD